MYVCMFVYGDGWTGWGCMYLHACTCICVLEHVCPCTCVLEPGCSPPAFAHSHRPLFPFPPTRNRPIRRPHHSQTHKSPSATKPPTPGGLARAMAVLGVAPLRVVGDGDTAVVLPLWFQAQKGGERGLSEWRLGNCESTIVCLVK